MAQKVQEPRPTIDRRKAAAERLRGMLGRDPSRSFTDELISERRAAGQAEARAEAERARR